MSLHSYELSAVSGLYLRANELLQTQRWCVTTIYMSCPLCLGYIYLQMNYYKHRDDVSLPFIWAVHCVWSIFTCKWIITNTEMMCHYHSYELSTVSGLYLPANELLQTQRWCVTTIHMSCPLCLGYIYLQMNYYKHRDDVSLPFIWAVHCVWAIFTCKWIITNTEMMCHYHSYELSAMSGLYLPEKNKLLETQRWCVTTIHMSCPLCLGYIYLQINKLLETQRWCITTIHMSCLLCLGYIYLQINKLLEKQRWCVTTIHMSCLLCMGYRYLK